jgi:hypothetical protein
VIEIKDIYWTAGFLEGEGTFIYNRRKAGGGSQMIIAAQKVIEPLERLQKLFGGTIHKSKVSKLRQLRKPDDFIYRWYTKAATSRGLMMTLYSLMSPKRQEQIRRALNHPGRWYTTYRIHDAELLAQVKADYQAGMSQFAIQQKYRLGGSRVSRWVRDGII